MNEDGPLYRKVFTRMLTFTPEQFSQMDSIVQSTILRYTNCILEEYRVKNPIVYSKLISIYQNGEYILGIGFGRKVTNAEQECAKQCLLNLQIDLNF